MKRWIGLALVAFLGAAGWRIGGVLSPDALSMAVGVLFGVMAGVPTALLVMAAYRRRQAAEECRQREQQAHSIQHGWGAPYAQQPPIIVVAGPQGFGSGLNSAAANNGWPAQDPPARQFTVVGDREELTEDW